MLFQTREFTVSSVAMVTEWMVELLPHREDLEALCGVADEYASKTGEDPALIPIVHTGGGGGGGVGGGGGGRNSSKAKGFLRDGNLAAYPRLTAMPLADRRRRFHLLQQFNSCMAIVSPAFDMAKTSSSWRLGYVRSRCCGSCLNTRVDSYMIQLYDQDFPSSWHAYVH